MTGDRLYWVFHRTAANGPGDGPYLDEKFAIDRADAFGGRVVGVDVMYVYESTTDGVLRPPASRA